MGLRTHRLFFALWPTDALRAKIADALGPLLVRAEARPIPAQNFHITLAFLGATPAHRIPKAIEAADCVEAAPVHLMFGRVEAWRGTDILCLTPAPSPELSTLVNRLRVNLLAQQVEPDQKDFRPHLTLARDWHEPTAERAVGPFEWSSSEFVLVESEATRSGSAYRIIGRWPLRAKGSK